MALNARLMGRILSVQKILVGGIEKTPEGAVTDGKVTQYMLIRGSTGNDAIVDTNGNLVCMLKGSENLPIAQDASGNMVAVIKGSEDLIIAQDTSGNMIAAMKGLEGANVRDIAVDVNGNMVTLMKGDDGANLQTIKVDSNGQMYVAMTGQSLSVDNHPSDYFKASEYPSDYAKGTDVPSDYFKADESAVMKGDDAGTKRLVAVDTSGIMLSRMKGAHGAVLKDILLDDTGIMLSRMKGSFGGALKDIGVDTDGNMISIMKGAAGNNVAVDANGYLAASMKGLEGANVRDIAVDASGNMISVMKGNYEGALKTWKVDTDGRGEMFLNDPLDVWGNVVPMGLAEHAVRTHAPPMPFDRRGDLIYWDDYESPTQKYIKDVVGSGTMGRSPTTAKFGSFSLKCVTDAVTNHYCQAIYQQVDYHDGNIGAQVSFACSDDDYAVVWVGNFYDGVNMHIAGVKWTESTEKLAYWGDDGVYHDLSGTYPFYANTHSWGTLKVVCDIVSKKYIRVLFMNNEIDLSSYSMETSANATKRNFSSYFKLIPLVDTAKTCYFDDFKITENEPEN